MSVVEALLCCSSTPAETVFTYKCRGGGNPQYNDDKEVEHPRLWVAEPRSHLPEIRRPPHVHLHPRGLAHHRCADPDVVSVEGAQPMGRTRPVQLFRPHLVADRLAPQ
jgi:hypothetical protein